MTEEYICRPAFDFNRFYSFSKKAAEQGSEHAIEGLDLIIDEFSTLIKDGLVEEVDIILQRMDVNKIHADILDGMQSIVEGVEGLKYGSEFCRKAQTRIEEIDGARKKFKLRGSDGKIVSEDVRADARKLYRQRAKKFGEMLRAGTLSQGMPGLHRGGPPILKQEIPKEGISPVSPDSLESDKP
ncbi:MAG TPA: hypothetical protein VIE65_02765 [Methylobacter sp.]|jgi:hypothetical protein